MQNFLKEKKKIVRTITKCGSPDVVAPEVHFYIRSTASYRTPELTAHSPEALTIEFIDGISCFNYLKQLRDDEVKVQYLDFLVGEVRKFQKEARNLELIFKPYAIEEKLEETIQIMREVRHPLLGLAEQTKDNVLKSFHQIAVVPFRDATPKNSIIRLDGAKLEELDVEQLKERTYHYDFSTVNELTSPDDDIISTLYHHFIDDNTREKLLRKYGVDTENIQFIVTAYLRIGRFWSRRYYYKRYHPDLFETRYNGEDINYYDRIFSDSLVKVGQVYG